MSFPRYPEYKDSGVEWLGAVPGHWGVRKARWLCEIKKRIAGELGHEVLSITQQGIRVRDLESNDGQISMDYSKYQIVEAGDFAMNHMDLLTGYVDIANVRGVTSPDYRVFSIRDPEICHDQYLLYLFQMGYKNRIFYAYGQGSSQLGRWRMPTEQFYELAFPLPPTPEQTQIAAFLDRETAKIDALVAEQRRLMALLKEKRQAVISHAVTRGLNPHAPMKPSGIEWLGDVPEHWEVTKLSRITTKIGDGLHGTPEYVDESEFYFINGNNLANGIISITDTTRCVSEVERDKHGVELNQTTVLLSINGTIGNFALYLGESVMLGKSAAYINCGEKVLRDYLCWCMQSSGSRRYFDFSVTGTTIYNLSLDSIRKMPMALPSCDEQIAICACLVERAGEYDELIQEAQRAIDLLQERRTALISAAVTGQIDVRGAV